MNNLNTTLVADSRSMAVIAIHTNHISEKSAFRTSGLPTRPSGSRANRKLMEAQRIAEPTATGTLHAHHRSKNLQSNHMFWLMECQSDPAVCLCRDKLRVSGTVRKPRAPIARFGARRKPREALLHLDPVDSNQETSKIFHDPHVPVIG